MSTGVVQLPMKMQPFFSNGVIQASVDGEAIALEFSGPRRLGGLKRHFEQRGLSANDRVRFELEVAEGKIVTLNASCVKRERSKPPLVPRTVSGQASSGASDGSGSDRLPGQLETTSRAGESSGWESASTVRAVRRVTIIGSDAPPPRYEAQAARSTAGAPPAARPTSQERAAPSSWRALDGLTPGGPLPEPSEADYSDTVVRAIRRRPAGAPTTPPAAEPTAPQVGEETRARGAERPTNPAFTTTPTPSYEPQRMRLADLVAPAEPGAPTPPAQRPAAARPRIFAFRGPRVDHDAPGFASLTPGSAQSVPNPKQAPAPELIEERELVPVARPAAKAVNVEAAAPQGDAGSAVYRAAQGAAQSAAQGAAGNPGSSPAGRFAPPASPTRAGGPGPNGANGGISFGAGSRDVEGPGARDASAVAEDRVEHRSERFVDDDEVAFQRALKGGEILDKRTQSAAPQQPTFGGPGARPAATPGGAGQVAATPSAPGAGSAPRATAVTGSAGPAGFAHETGSLEEAVRLIRAHLDRPGTPAIVRSDLIAVELGLDGQRCELALERLSENRERVSRIRKGAYMIRKDATRRDEAHP